MDINLLREAVTLASFVSFVGIVAYAVLPANKERFEKAANSVLEEGDER